MWFHGWCLSDEHGGTDLPHPLLATMVRQVIVSDIQAQVTALFILHVFFSLLSPMVQIIDQ